MEASGLIGLGSAVTEFDGEACDLFVDKMKEAGTIENAMFAIYLDLQNDNSKITFGGYDLNRFAVQGLTE